MTFEDKQAGEALMETVDYTSLPLPAPRRKQQAYEANAVDALRIQAQGTIDSLVREKVTLNQQLSDAVNKLNKAEVDQASVSEQNEILDSANAELRNALQQATDDLVAVQGELAAAREALSTRTDSEEASELLVRAAALAEEHVSKAKERAENIEREAEESISELQEEISRLRNQRDSVREQIKSGLQLLLDEVDGVFEEESEEDNAGE